MSAERIKLISLSLFALLLLAIPAPLQSISAQSASTPSCPASQTIKITLTGGAPDTLASILTTGSTPAFEISQLEFYGIYPELGPTGVQYWNMSLVDWVHHNANYTQWTVNVRPGLKWSNGQPVTADDIIATYSPTFGFSPQYDFTGAHQETTSVTKVNSSAVLFSLNKSDAHYIETISTLVLTNVLPAADANGNYTGFNTDQVVVGPFYAHDYTPGQTLMVMYRNPYFYTTGLPEPNACELLVNFVESTADSETYITSQSVDLAEVDPSAVATILQNPNLHILSQTGNLIQSIDWNVTTYPFNMTAFRQAMVYAVNQSEIVQKAWAGYGITAYNAEGTVPPTISYYFDKNQMTYNYNPTKALSLLNSIGITKGTDGNLHWKNGTAVSLTMWSDDSSTFDTVAAGIVRSNLQSLGVQVNLHLTSFANLGSFPTVAPYTMYLASNHGAIFPDPAIDAQPGWNVYSEPGIPPTSGLWEYPPSINNEYFSNLTAINNTDQPSQLQKYLNNIQEINAVNLPTFVTSYGASLYAYTDARWTNWGAFPQSWVHLNDNTDPRLFALLQPVTTPPVTTTTTVTGAGATTTAVVSSGVPMSTLLAVIAVAAILVIIIAAVAVRRTRGAKKKGPQG